MAQSASVHIPGGFVILARVIRDSKLWSLRAEDRIVGITCILMANWAEGNSRGETLKRGEFHTTLKDLAKESKLSIRQIRTSIEHLIKIGFLTHQPTHHLTKITICNYLKYQEIDNYKREADTQIDTTSDTRPTHARHTPDTPILKEEVRRKKKGEEAPPSFRATDPETDLVETLKVFEDFESPSKATIAREVRDLLRQGIPHGKIRAYGQANQKSPFYDIVDALKRADKASLIVPHIPAPATSAPPKPKKSTYIEIQQIRDHAHAHAREKFKELPEEVVKEWREEALLEASGVPGYMRDRYVENAIILRTAKKFGIEGL